MIQLYIVVYDPSPCSSCHALVSAIKQYGACVRIGRFAWAIRAVDSPAQIRDNLANCIDAEDRLFVGGLTGQWATCGLPDAVADWLR